MSLQFAVLGPLEVRRDGLVLGLTRARERALLTLLLLDAGRTVPAARLVDDLWAGSPPPNAASALRSYVSRLRGHLGPDADTLQGGPAGYRLTVGADALDSAQFAGLVARGRTLAADGEHAAAAETLRAALALWRGRALDDVADLPCAQAAAARLEEARLGALEDRIAADVASGAHRAVIAELEELTVRHPLREQLWTTRMLALHRAGRTAEALATYRELHAVLDRELGLPPGDDARRLQAAVLRRDPGLDPDLGGPRRDPARPGAGAPLPPRLSVRPAGAFVGRQAEQRRLAKALEPVAAGAGRRVVLVAGEAGIGKTTLLAEFGRAAHEAGATVGYGRCDAELGVPYQPFAEALAHLVAHLPSDHMDAHTARHGGDLAVLVPGLTDRTRSAPRSEDPGSARFLLYAAAADLLTRAAAPGPLVLLLDDLHWADPPTLGLLRYLVGSVTIPGLLVAVTFRASEASDGDPAGPGLAALRRDDGVEDLEVTGLDPEAVAALVGAAAPALAERLHRETGGNPFYVNELMRHLAERGLLRAGPQEWDGAGLPDSVRATVRRRVALLGGGAERLLTVAAVAGREFGTHLLGHAVGAAEAEVLDALASARDAALVTELGPGRFGFVHAVVQHALTDVLGPSRLALTHRQVADAIEALHGSGPGPRAAELAGHRLAAGAGSPGAAGAMPYLCWAGEAAMAALAPEEAARWYAAALGLLPAGAPAGERVDLLTALGRAQLLAGDPGHRETLLAASGLARAAGDDRRLVSAVLADSRGTFSQTLFVDAERVDALRAALAVVPEGSEAHARVLAVLSVELTWTGMWEERRALAEAALAVARALDDPACFAAVACIVYLAIWAPENLDQRLELTAEVVAFADAQPDPSLRHWPHRMRMQSCLDAGDVAAVDHHVGVLAAAAESSGDPHQIWAVAMIRAWQALLAADLESAAWWTDEALRVGTERGQPETLMIYGLQLGALRRLQGRSGELVEPLTASAAFGLGRAVLALACCESGDADRARELLAAEHADSFRCITYDFCWFDGICSYADVAAQVSDADAGRTLYDMLAPWSGMIVGVHGCLASGPVDLHLANLALLLGDPAAAQSHARTALALADPARLPFWGARAQICLARALQACGEAAATVTALLESAAGTAAVHGLVAVQRELAGVDGRALS